MNCPKCPGKLQKKYLEGVEVDVCYICEGIWFDEKELDKVIAKDSMNFNFKNVDREEFDGKEINGLEEEVDKKEGECPKCEDGTMLSKEEYSGTHKIMTDICPKGHGVWLDGGELLKIRKRGLVMMVDLLKYIKKLIASKFSR